jgi:hypothetical protein
MGNGVEKQVIIETRRPLLRTLSLDDVDALAASRDKPAVCMLSSGLPTQQLPGDDQALDLGSALADLADFGIS